MNKNNDSSGKITVNQVNYDWFTVTSYDDELYLKVSDVDIKFNRETDAKRMQYDGVVKYADNGSLFIGSGRQAASIHNMVVVTGALAHDMRHIVKECLLECDGKLTRVDIQTTIQEPAGWHDKGQWRLFNRLKRSGQTVGWIESNDRVHGELATVYRGSMKSERLARVYQKPSEADRPLLRLEYVLKGRQAQSYGLGWIGGKTNSRKAFMALLDWFRDDTLTDHYRFILQGYTPYLPTVLRAETKTERWLMGAVLTSFRRFINQHDSNGRVKDAFKQAIEEVDQWGRGVVRED